MKSNSELAIEMQAKMNRSFYVVSKNDGQSRFAVRVGYFSTVSESKRYLDSSDIKENYPNTQVVKLNYVHETIPGQNVNLQIK